MAGAYQSIIRAIYNQRLADSLKALEPLKVESLKRLSVEALKR